jgi:hypothetical protein
VSQEREAHLGAAADPFPASLSSACLTDGVAAVIGQFDGLWRTHHSGWIPV